MYTIYMKYFTDFLSFLYSGYVLDDFPTLSEATLTAKDQLELIRNWKLKPDFIINVKVNTPIFFNLLSSVA